MPTPHTELNPRNVLRWLLITNYYCFVFISVSFSQLGAEEAPLREEWDYVPSMQRVARGFTGHEGLVLHIGGALVQSRAYGHWARFGQGQTPEEKTALRWMHTDGEHAEDGWWLARTPKNSFGTHTTGNHLLSQQLMLGQPPSFPPIGELITRHNPRIVVLCLGEEDLALNVEYETFRLHAEKIVDAILVRQAICIITTLPPNSAQLELGAAYNRGWREIAAERHLPLIDFEREILRRRPEDWNGSLLPRNDLLPSETRGAVNAGSAPTPENLRESGYLLLGWLTVRKLTEVKREVIDSLVK